MLDKMLVHQRGILLTGVLTENVPSKLRPGGRKRVNELRLGGRMSSSNVVRWDTIRR